MLTILMLAAMSCLSPDGRNVLSCKIGADGRPEYSFVYHGKTVVRSSGLGLEFRHYDPRKPWFADAPRNWDMMHGFEVVGEERRTIDETWRPVWGEESEIRNHCNELAVTVRKHLEADNYRYMTVRFRVFDDGIGFRYEFPEQRHLTYATILEERTEFAMAGDHRCWWIPIDFDTQEYSYNSTRLSGIHGFLSSSRPSRRDGTFGGVDGVQTAVVMKTDDGLYLNIHEAACVDYSTMHLRYDSERNVFESFLTPDAEGWKGRLQAPQNTPWRTVIVGECGADILASRITLNLNEPCKIADTSWIHPTKYIGIWWDMITDVGTWRYTDDLSTVRLSAVNYAKTRPNGRHCANTANVKRYIDFAAAHGFDAVLVEGWNVGWEDWIGNQKDYVFDFVTPYPDFDVAAIRDYARMKDVRMIMHHETSGSTRNYERHLADAYRFMNENGYDAVKSGYVGMIIPYGERHYSQWSNNHYLYCVTEAAKNRIMVNAHEATRPTGICRTWPNWIANESARGTEYEWFEGNTPDHAVILPFTRLVGGPMDYTPGIFEFDMTRINSKVKKRHVISSTLVGQLALYVTMYSPLQMACDTPQHYEQHPDAFKFIKDVAVDWDVSRYLAAEIGDRLVIARRAKGRKDWFVGGKADECGFDYSLALNFLDQGVSYAATIYEDAPGAAFGTNPAAYRITRRIVRKGDAVQCHAGPGGGFAVSIMADVGEEM